MLINRDEYLNKLISYKDKDIIKVITGVRRCGKSVLLFEIYYNYLLSIGISKDNIICINLENKENAFLRTSDNLFNYITKKISGPNKFYVFIDEIQYIDNFEDLVNSLKNKGCDVYITGSNSKMLSGEINTALRGRSIEIRVHTLSFLEFYTYTGGEKQTALKEYIKYGGFPYVATEKDYKLKEEYLNMLQNTVATKDIIEKNNIRHPDMFNAVYDFLCSNIGGVISPKKIADTLKTNGYKTITPDTVGNYLSWICDAFLFTKVYRYDIKGKEYLKTLNKYYASDIGLRNARLNYRQIEITHTIENIVYNELIREGYHVDIGKNKEKEIDFIASNTKDTYYIQVAYSIADPDKKEQELKSFRNIDDGYKKIVITMDSDPFVLLENGYKKLDLLNFLCNPNSLINI